MKKLILTLLATCLINISFAQTNNILPTGVQVTPEGVETPVIVTNKFNIDYPNNNAMWQKDDDNYIAEFTDINSNQRYAIVYDEEGKLIRRDMEVGNTIYPKTISNYYNKNYPNESYTIWLSEDKNGQKTYYSKRKSLIILFDNKGRYISTKSK